MNRQHPTASAASASGSPSGSQPTTPKPKRAVTEDDVMSTAAEPMSEIDRFFKIQRGAIPRDETAETWWARNYQSFRKVYALACKYLVVPATSAGPERQFSRARRINSPKRVALKPSKLQSLVFLGENMDLAEQALEGRRNIGQKSLK
jgi:hypothetical protein